MKGYVYLRKYSVYQKGQWYVAMVKNMAAQNSLLSLRSLCPTRSPHIEHKTSQNYYEIKLGHNFPLLNQV